MSDSLKDKTISGLKWSGIEKIFQQVFVFTVGILLARKLDVEDYGLVAVLSIFSFMANALQESGFTAALIRKKDANDDDYSTTFHFNTGVSVVLYLILFFCAPLISDFYEKPQLLWLSRFVFLSFLFNAIGAVQNTQLIKALNYKLNTKISIISIILSYSLALTLAYNNFGAWALAAQAVSLAFFRTLFLWIGNKWRPRFIFSVTSFKELFGFGSNLLLKSILDTITTRITPNIIGKSMGLHSAGIYDNGNRIYSTAFDFLNGTILNVAYPVLSKVEDELRLKHIFRKMVRTSSFLIFPFFLGMFLVARPFVISLLEEKWIDAIGVVQLLAIGGIFIAFNSLFMHIIKIKGKPSFILITEIIYTGLIFIVLFLAIFFKWNVYAVVGGIVMSNFLGHTIIYFMTKNLIKYNIFEYLRDIFPYFGIAFAACTIGYTLTFLIENNLILLITQIICVTIIYFGITYISGSAVIKEVMSLIKKQNTK